MGQRRERDAVPASAAPKVAIIKMIDAVTIIFPFIALFPYTISLQYFGLIAESE